MTKLERRQARLYPILMGLLLTLSCLPPVHP